MKLSSNVQCEHIYVKKTTKPELIFKNKVKMYCNISHVSSNDILT